MRTAIRTAMSALVIMCALPAFAQEQAPSSVDKGAGANAGDKAASPKTTGAMNKTTDSIATSPQDVGAQQKGEKTAAEGGGDRPGAPKIDEKQVSPGTVGAAPATGGKADVK